jgi:hypothetical protein
MMVLTYPHKIIKLSSMEMSRGGRSMSKFGVGVGDDFPVDDGNGQGADQGPPRDEREEFEDWKRRREAHRARHEQYRQQRAEWQERKSAFKEKIRAAARESFGDGRHDDDRHYGGWQAGPRRSHFPFFLWPAIGLMIPILIIALLVAIIAAVFKSPFVFLGLVLLAFLFFGFRHHHWAGPGHGHWHDRDRWRRRDNGYDVDLKPSSASTSEPKQTPSSSAAAPQDGGK